jgi:hypothetical protein
VSWFLVFADYVGTQRALVFTVVARQKSEALVDP